MPERTPDLLDRFASKVDRCGPVPEYAPDLGPCWIWSGFISSDGYGIASIPTGTRGADVWRAHRMFYELLIAPVPKGLVIDHLCRVRHCVNPHHLEPVTNAENLRRGKIARRAARDAAPQGGWANPRGCASEGGGTLVQEGP